MNTAERRGEILKILHNADAPVAARELAEIWCQPSGDRAGSGGDKASMPGILSTTKGNVLQQDSSCSARI